MRKKVDSRIRTLVERCVALRHRSLFVIVGDKGRDQARRHPPTPTPVHTMHAGKHASTGPVTLTALRQCTS